MQENPKISLLHPTARVSPSEAFPQGWYAAAVAWAEAASAAASYEYVITVHESRWVEFWASAEAEGWIVSRGLAPVVADQVAAVLECGITVRVVVNTGRDCVVDQLNTAGAAAVGAVLMGLQDDYFPPVDWDLLTLEALGRHIDAEALCVFSSGASAEKDRELMIAGAITRKRYERYGWCLDPDFESMFSDNWYAFQARRDEAAGLVTLIERLDIRFEHRHPLFGLNQVDDVYRTENRAQAYSDGLITFKKKMGSRLIAIGLPGQTFSSQWVHGWTKLYGHLMAGRDMLTMPVFLYTSNVHCTRIEFTKTVLESRHRPDLVLSIDDDNVLEPEQFDMLLADLDADPTLSGVVGWCWCDPADPLGEKNQPFLMSCGRQTGWTADREENGSGLRASMFTLEDFQGSFDSDKRAPHLISSADLFPDAFWSGFPVVLMRRSALEVLGPEAFLPMVRPDVRFGFTSEDTTFFYRAHMAGLNFAVDVRVKVPHLKLRAIEPQYLPGVDRQDVLKAQGKILALAD